MKIKQKRNNKKIWIAAVLIVIMATLVTWFVFLRPSDKQTSSNNNGVNYDKPTDEQIKAGNQTKEEVIRNDQTQDDPKLDGDTDSNTSRIETRLTAASVEADTLYIRSETTGIYSTGSCKLNLTKGPTLIERSASVQPLPKATTCKGFNIPVGELSHGKWKIELIVTIGEQVSRATGFVEV